MLWFLVYCKVVTSRRGVEEQTRLVEFDQVVFAVPLRKESEILCPQSVEKTLENFNATPKKDVDKYQKLAHTRTRRSHKLCIKKDIPGCIRVPERFVRL